MALKIKKSYIQFYPRNIKKVGF